MRRGRLARLASRRSFAVLAALWACLAVPAAALSDHTCHGFVGLLAHSPMYAFQLLTPVLVVVSLVAATGPGSGVNSRFRGIGP